jgi:hypothetical protein
VFIIEVDGREREKSTHVEDASGCASHTVVTLLKSLQSTVSTIARTVDASNEVLKE